ncbi:efflux RND transporter periplasmic adaptor subunit [Peribacillus alkalitolerans]|uniref:efflux RND transporter periplasmic adaptor subunit n=1 Tax=Peribacillus alkalitolerans TaxID=1550385 RepID=UPI001F086B06|nr:efflux RND transporter periplasmic adaptor subunit [Peribacillus alkalitolerans]
MKKWIITGIILVITSAGAFFFFSNKPQEIMAQSPTASAEQGKLDVQVSGSGNVASVHNEDLFVDENKTIDEVLVVENQAIKKGDELFTFTDDSDPVTAPFAGIVTSIAVEEDDKVGEEKALAHITNYNILETVISVDEVDVPKIKVGQTVSLTASAFPEERFAGKVTGIAKEGTVENGSSTFDVTISINDSKSLKPGMTTEASILVESKGNVIKVPIEAVRKQGDQKFVLVQTAAATEQGQATWTRKEIKTGLANDTYVEVTSGLQAGELVQLPALVSGSNNGQMSTMMMPNGMGGFGGGQGFVGQRQGQGMPSERR